MSSQNKKILIIEDEQAFVRNLELALKDNYEISSAPNGKEGIVKAKNELPNLILLDFMLPDMDGFEILTELKADEKTDGIPVIVLTNRSDQETVSKIITAGGKEYLVKADWSIADVVEKIKASL